MNRATTVVEIRRDSAALLRSRAGRKRRRHGHRTAVMWAAGVALVLIAAVIVAVPGRAESDPISAPASPRLEGLSLAEALTSLGAAGMKIVFTNHVVTADMRVTEEPRATEPGELLAELVAPHGLEVREGPGRTWVVVRRVERPQAAASIVRGVIRSLSDLAPIPGAFIRIVGTAAETSTSDHGIFQLAGPSRGSFTLEIRHDSFTGQRHESLSAGVAREVDLAIFLSPVAVFSEELVIVPSRVSLMRDKPVTALDLGREEILALPHLADDFFRALSVLPGITSNDLSAQFHTRGGRRDETQILLDGQELFEAYHLKDYDSALSFVASAALGSADLTTGGFLAEHGDRMSGVLDMTTLVPTGAPKRRIGIGVLSAQIGGGGGFHRDRGSWFVEFRRGTIDLASRIFGSEDPQYWDGFGKVGYDLGPRNSLYGSLLRSSDDLTFSQMLPQEEQRIDNTYDSTYAWLTHGSLLSPRWTVETSVSWSELLRDRDGIELEDDARFTVEDRRDTEILELRQQWNFEATSRHDLKWGFAIRHFDSRYDYFSVAEFDNSVSEVREQPNLEASRFEGRFTEDHQAVHVSDRMQLFEPLQLELGLRYDRYTLTDEEFVSPRVNLAWSLGETSLFRVAWGEYNQSQRPYELLVEDGDTNFYPVERSQHRIVGFEKLIRSGSPSGGLALRVELYERSVDNPRPRYENLYEPINFFPEVEPDRVRIEPQESRARGVELFLRGRSGTRLGWWINYAWATTEDRIAGTWIPRQYDQPHTFRFDLDYRLGKHWSLNLAWRYHTGWPTTPIDFEIGEDDEGEPVLTPILGPLNSDRLSIYHRLDLRASRQWLLESGVLTLFVDIQNVYNRTNAAGFDIFLDEEEGLVVTPEAWPGIFPSAGIRFEF